MSFVFSDPTPVTIHQSEEWHNSWGNSENSKLQQIWLLSQKKKGIFYQIDILYKQNKAGILRYMCAWTKCFSILYSIFWLDIGQTGLLQKQTYDSNVLFLALWVSLCIKNKCEGSWRE